jgi:hypothetical protein
MTMFKIIKYMNMVKRPEAVLYNNMHIVTNIIAYKARRLVSTTK